MNEQIEAAAEAIWRVFTGRMWRKSKKTWADVPRVLKDRYREEAKATLSAAAIIGRDAA
jgi:hypothetical protein